MGVVNISSPKTEDYQLNSQTMIPCLQKPWLLLLSVTYLLLILTSLANGNALSRILFNSKYLPGSSSYSDSLSPVRSWPPQQLADSGPNSNVQLIRGAARAGGFLPPRMRRECAPENPSYDCGDGLMGVWLRLMKNPDYDD